MTFILAALVAAFLVTLYIVRRTLAGARAGRAVPGGARLTAWTRASNLKGWGRAGGLGVAVGLLLSLVLRLFDSVEIAGSGLLLLLAAMPVFVAGVLDDFTQNVRPAIRLAAAFVSGAWADTY